MKTALSIAGSDSSGGAGIQADLKTMTMNGVYAMSAITALTAQNTTGVSAILDVTPHFLQQQIDAVFTDIPPDAVKIGMVSSAPLIQTIARCLRTYQAANIVVDPVMVATSGARLLDEDAVETLTQTLLPLADLLTPNLPEAEVLSGCSIQTEADMVTAARRISQTTAPAVPSPAPSRPTWPKGFPCPRQYSGPRTTSPRPWPPCWTWDRVPVPCTTVLPSPAHGPRRLRRLSVNPFPPLFLSVACRNGANSLC